MSGIVMTYQRHTIASCIAGLALIIAGTAHASACWDARTVGAARISELETMLLLSSLRCRIIGFDFHESYDHFADTYKDVFDAAQFTLKTHFDADGSDGGRREYDRYLTGVANFYGTGRTDADTCHAFEAINTELGSAAANSDMIPMIAMEMVRDPHFDGPRCPSVQSPANTGR